jgi:hypothetical protein
MGCRCVRHGGVKELDMILLMASIVARRRWMPLAVRVETWEHAAEARGGTLLELMSA